MMTRVRHVLNLDLKKTVTKIMETTIKSLGERGVSCRGCCLGIYLRFFIGVSQSFLWGLVLEKI